MQMFKDSVATSGYAFVRDYRPEEDTAAIGQALGVTLVPWEGRLVQELVPRATATPNTYSGIFGLERFPFHTDLAHWPLPPRYLLLRCINGYDDVPTLLIDGHSIVDAVTLDVLRRAIVRPRRPRDGALPLMRLCETTDNGIRLRWDEVFLKPASKIGDAAYKQVQERLAQTVPLRIALARIGDTLLVDNWRMLHARSPIPIGREDRKLERLYLRSLH